MNTKSLVPSVATSGIDYGFDPPWHGINEIEGMRVWGSAPLLLHHEPQLLYKQFSSFMIPIRYPRVGPLATGRMQ